AVNLADVGFNRAEQTISSTSRLFRTMTGLGLVVFSGNSTVDGPWKEGTIVVAAKNLEFRGGSVVEFGHRDVIIITHTLKVDTEGATMRAFNRRGNNFEGTHRPSLSSGNV